MKELIGYDFSLFFLLYTKSIKVKIMGVYMVTMKSYDRIKMIKMDVDVILKIT